MLSLRFRDPQPLNHSLIGILRPNIPAADVTCTARQAGQLEISMQPYMLLRRTYYSVCHLKSIRGISICERMSTDKIPASAVPELELMPEAGPSKRTAAQKWHNPDGPPVGSNFGARILDDDQDVWSHNAW